MPDSSQLPAGSNLEAELRQALAEGDPQQVRDLIAAGADVRYQREEGYDALVDAVHGRDIARDPNLLELLAILVAHGADLSGITSYGESGLRVLSRVGRFDGVRFLLAAGADRSHLAWTPLLEAVALGSLADVEAALAQGEALEARDWWERTPWLLALVTGDLAKAKLLLEHGADRTACGRCGCPPLFYAIEGRHWEMVRWLLREGADVHQTDEFGTTALNKAIAEDDLDCVNLLLDAGANVEAGAYGTAVKGARSRAIIMRLLEAGANPADASQHTILGLEATGEAALAAIAPDEFRRTFTRTFGTQNPERMRVPFWEAMIRCGTSAYLALRHFETDSPPSGPDRLGLYTEERKSIRAQFSGPVWCAQRFGQSLTLLPDGRAVQIGGEHEDHYDADFCIYNDVFVHERDGSIAIYGYPEAVFPPTDFHTATLLGDGIYVIGSLGYPESRRCGETPVYRLDIHTLRMERLHPQGAAPGWIYQHRAVAVPPNGIRIWGGTVETVKDDTVQHEPNRGSFVLDLERLCWQTE